MEFFSYPHLDINTVTPFIHHLVIHSYYYPIRLRLFFSMSSNLRQTRGISHKKNKRLVATIKLENAVIAKKARLSNRPTRSSLSSTSSVIIDINDDNINECTVTATSVVEINSSPAQCKNLIVTIR